MAAVGRVAICQIPTMATKIGAEIAVDIVGAQVGHHLGRWHHADLDVGVGVQAVFGQVVAQQEVVDRVVERDAELEALPILRVAVVLEAFAHAFGVVGLEQAHGLGVVAEEVAVLAVADAREQFDCLRPRRFIARGGRVVERFDRSHGHGHVTLQGRFGVAEQAFAGLFDLFVRLFLEDEQRGQADDQRKEQHRKNGEGQDFSLEAQAHCGGSLFWFYWRG